MTAIFAPIRIIEDQLAALVRGMALFAGDPGTPILSAATRRNGVPSLMPGLTSARSGEMRLATWDEMDLDAGVWTIPGARMKAKRDHRVPLSGRALAILHDVQRLSDGTGLVFRSLRGKPLSNTTLSKLIKELGIAAVPHGFRSSFRDWAAERTNTPREVVEGRCCMKTLRWGGLTVNRRGILTPLGG